MQIEPFFFGKSRSLHGIYHAPQRATVGRAVVLVPPLLNDAVRSHSAFRKIAINLSEKGIPVLRFDFSGTGNSRGKLASISLSNWVDDILVASREISDISGARSISVATARFSANIVAAASQQFEFDRVSLWDPIFSHRAWMDLMRDIRERTREKVGNVDDVGENECMGYALSASMMEQLTGEPDVALRCRSACVVSTTDTDVPIEVECEDVLQVLVDDPCDWNSTSSQRILPHGVIDQICGCQL